MKNFLLYILPLFLIFSQHHLTKNQNYTSIASVVSINASESTNQLGDNEKEIPKEEEEEDLDIEEEDIEEENKKTKYHHFVLSRRLTQVQHFFQQTSLRTNLQRQTYPQGKIPFYILFVSLKIAF